MATGSKRGRGGGFSVTRLRRWLLAGVILLLALLAGLIGYTRYKTRKLITDLPRRLGADVKSETNGFTWSQSVKGHTIFTIHAAKAIQRDNGKTTLHDVAITLYGPVGSNRTDSIRGEQFEYDQPNGIVRAEGEVHLDLASPAPGLNPLSGVQEAVAAKLGGATPARPVAAANTENSSKRIQVTTSGLIFIQKLATAATDKPIQIVYGDLRGGATGADYESDTGMLRLRSAVEMSGTQNRQAVHVHAAAAEIDRAAQIATMHTAHVETDTTRASGDTVVITMAPSGGIQRVHTNGRATLSSKNGMTAEAPAMDAQMGAAGKLKEVVMQGGVRFADGPGSSGSAQRSTVRFDNAGLATSAEFNGDVHLDQSTTAGQRTLNAEHVVTALGQDSTGHTQLRNATASGSATLRTVETVPGKNGAAGQTRTSTLRGGTLRAITARAGNLTYVSDVSGDTNTSLEQNDGAGAVRTSTGDQLHVTLTPPSPPSRTVTVKTTPSSADKASGQIRTAVQTGHVVVTEKAPATKTRPAQNSRATGARAEYDSASGRLVLTGSPQVTSPELQLAADRISLQQAGGDAEATGAVHGVYLATAADTKHPADPVHFIADHAAVAGGGSSAKLFGTPGKAARMWSSSMQIDAPVIETDRATGHLFAHPTAPTGAIHLLLPAAADKDTKSSPGALHITGGSLVYSPADPHGPAHADITGGVRMDSPGTQLTAKSAVAVLAGTAPVKGTASSPLPGGNVQSITATGDVHLQQPGRSGTGERLVYTAAGQRYELTGTASTPPRITDSQRGVITGTSLVFHGADDSVEVSGEAGHRVRTETEVTRPAHGR